MRGARRLFLFALGAPLAVAVIVVTAWTADTSRSGGRVLRNVTLAGEDIGGATRAELRGVVRRLAGAYAAAPVAVEAPGGGFSMEAGEMGLALDEESTIEAALGAGRPGNVVEQVIRWVKSFADPYEAPVAVRVDQAAVHRIVASRDRGRTPPTEPSVKSVKGRLVAVDGTPGLGIDAAAVLAALPRAARQGPPVTVRVDRGKVPPRFSLAEARRLAARGNAATARPLAVSLGDKPASVAPQHVRSWLRSEATDTGLRLVVDPAEVPEALGKLLPDVVTPPVETSFTVVGGVPQIVPGRPGTGCCAPEAVAAVDAAVQARLAEARSPEPVALPLRPVEPELTAEEAGALGIKEPVGSFTTNHAPNQPRVANIHRIADLVRGQVILPGKTFSINKFVGRRTAEKGFVVDAVIEDGKFAESVGGGISQFATTAFNAAFFAGLEFPEYQSHSLYISRYPYGREATLSYPKPDLKIRNPTPYGVLIWPTYTSRSITVTLYSTRWADVAQTNQTTERRGPCTRVRTERTRRLLADGTTKVDHVSALYRPEEGVNCT